MIAGNTSPQPIRAAIGYGAAVGGAENRGISRRALLVGGIGGAAAVVADCMQNNAVIIGMTNRSLPGFNNTLCFSPALICGKSDIDEIIDAVDGALTRVASA